MPNLWALVSRLGNVESEDRCSPFSGKEWKPSWTGKPQGQLPGAWAQRGLAAQIDDYALATDWVAVGLLTERANRVINMKIIRKINVFFFFNPSKNQFQPRGALWPQLRMPALLECKLLEGKLVVLLLAALFPTLIYKYWPVRGWLQPASWGREEGRADGAHVSIDREAEMWEASTSQWRRNWVFCPCMTLGEMENCY